ncbi:MAG: sodium:solute symporter [Acholeplasmatales bacterium]|nr:sodium:solute symporter [Acholeplasmatales bacterium]
MFIKILFIVIFFAVTFYIGFYCRKKAANSNDFVLGGRKVGPWLSAFAYGTSYFSAVIFIGYAGSFGLAFGVSALWIGLGNAFIGSLLAWKVLGKRTRQVTQKMKSATMPDFFEKRFQSRGLKIAAALIVFIFLIPYTAALYNGLGTLFSNCFSNDVPYWVWILIISVATGGYVIVGGLMSTAINSFVQGMIMLVGICLVVVGVLLKNGGLQGSMDALANIDWKFTSLFGPDPVHLLFVVILTSLGCWGLPQMVGKFYSINDGKQIQKGALISTIFAVIVAGGCYFLGGFGRLFDTNKGTVITTMVSSLNVVVIAIVIVLVLAASMSTLAGLVHTSSATVTFDLIDRNKNCSEKKKLTCLRVLVVVFIAISAGMAIFQYYGPAKFTKDIASLMGISWGAISGAFLAPFLFGLYWKKTTKASVWVCFGFGVGISVLGLILSLAQVHPQITTNSATGKILWFDFSDSIYMGVLGMLIGFAIVPIVSSFTKKPDHELVEDLFRAYEIDKEFAEEISTAYEDADQYEIKEEEKKEEVVDTKNIDHIVDDVMIIEEKK